MEYTAVELVLLVLCSDISNSNADFPVVLRKIFFHEGEKSR